MVQNKTNTDMEIMLALIRGKSHIREIARRIGESHSKVMRRINGLVKENVLDYNRDGRNKVFSIKNNLQARNYVYSAERYKLTKLLRKYPELGVVLGDVLKNASGKMIVLFGSYAKFSATPKSDIDLYIETEDSKLKRNVEGINSRISVKTGGFDAGSPLIREIIKNHVILSGIDEFYEKSGFFEKTLA